MKSNQNFLYQIINICILVLLVDFSSFSQNASFSSPEVSKCANQDGTAVIFSLNASNLGYSSYSWEISNPSISFSQIISGGSGFASISFPLSSPGLYTVKLTVNGNVSNVLNDFLELKELPSITINVPPFVCQNTLNLYTISIAQSYDYVKTFIGSAIYSTSSFSHAFLSSGTPTITTEVKGINGCINNKDSTVNVLQSPSLTSSLTPNAVCSETMFSYSPTTNPATGVNLQFVRDKLRL